MKNSSATVGSARSLTAGRRQWRTLQPHAGVSQSRWRVGSGSERAGALLLDGDPGFRREVGGVLRQLHYQVREVSSAVQAQRFAEAHPEIRLLVVNASAEDRSGIQLALWFRTTYPAIQVLVACEDLWHE